METLRFLNKQANQNERNLFNNWWHEQININGQLVNYYSNQSTLTGMNVLYGEEPSAGFALSQPLIVLLNLNNDSYLLSKFGIVADSDMTGVIHPIDFEKVFGVGSEPKPSDLIELTEYGSDRLHFPKRGATVFEFTEVIDEYVTNPLGSHNVWFFKGKRYDYSHEPGSPGAGQGNKPINDNDALEALAQSNFDYPVDNPCSNNSVYGEY
jgi:hypothetical protein